jgi:S-formylglutathione hydrolase
LLLPQSFHAAKNQRETRSLRDEKERSSIRSHSLDLSLPLSSSSSPSLSLSLFFSLSLSPPLFLSPSFKTTEKKMFGGAVRRYKHFSKSCGCDMTFSVFVPPAAVTEEEGRKAPVLLFLSGLTCTDENFTQKAGAQRAAAARGIALAAPDTSPRSLGVAGEDDGWDLGTGAGFYVDATREPWVEKGGDDAGGASRGYRMFSYVTVDLLEALREVPGLDASKIALSGHS